MEKTLGYIFNRLYLTETATAGIIRDLKVQNRLNKFTALAFLATTFCVCRTVEHCMDNNEKIEALEKEIEEMKKVKGE